MSNSGMLDPRAVTSKEDARRVIEERGLSHIKLGLFDSDGVMRGKHVSKTKFFSIRLKAFIPKPAQAYWKPQLR